MKKEEELFKTLNSEQRKIWFDIKYQEIEIQFKNQREKLKTKKRLDFDLKDFGLLNRINIYLILLEEEIPKLNKNSKFIQNIMRRYFEDLQKFDVFIRKYVNE